MHLADEVGSARLLNSRSLNSCMGGGRVCVMLMQGRNSGFRYGQRVWLGSPVFSIDLISYVLLQDQVGEV